ncbi:hypothetical protein J2Y03_002393 [Neobacillus niacini]|uniref:hypothetical protein n=1 Tax=Neobacillus niacini TaxID=86668 RepID=UPI0028624287|nr:hypothetical protein [Neobacillus niacini]MDR7077369.1 hypothetical protein [Neobacillus niacini]
MKQMNKNRKIAGWLCFLFALGLSSTNGILPITIKVLCGVRRQSNFLYTKHHDCDGHCSFNISPTLNK